MQLGLRLPHAGLSLAQLGLRLPHVGLGLAQLGLELGNARIKRLHRRRVALALVRQLVLVLLARRRQRRLGNLAAARRLGGRLLCCRHGRLQLALRGSLGLALLS